MFIIAWMNLSYADVRKTDYILYDSTYTISRKYKLNYMKINKLFAAEERKKQKAGVTKGYK